MNASHQTPVRTRMFARVLGPFITVIAIVVALRSPDMRGLLDEFTGSQVWPWVTGAYLLLGGIAVIAFHQYWRGAAEVIISVFGWVLAARGVFLLAFPEAFASVSNRVIGATAVWLAVYVAMAIVGLYLTYVGWRPEPRRSHGVSTHGATDLPRVA